ncbi:hypothetical protein T484DRAFT_1844794 [Baffinella frigidus]|nr:hypothetical protein T484DRAFT_1844794 [Cryptophyta sp. CCMP2293]
MVALLLGVAALGETHLLPAGGAPPSSLLTVCARSDVPDASLKAPPPGGALLLLLGQAGENVAALIGMCSQAGAPLAAVAVTLFSALASYATPPPPASTKRPARAGRSSWGSWGRAAVLLQVAVLAGRWGGVEAGAFTTRAIGQSVPLAAASNTLSATLTPDAKI